MSCEAENTRLREDLLQQPMLCAGAEQYFPNYSQRESAMLKNGSSLKISEQPKLLTIEYVPVQQLKQNPANARIHSQKQIRQIAASIKSMGFNVPVLIDQTSQLIAGHGRVEAAKLLGMTKVPALMLEHLSEAQIAAFAIADNKLTENAQWNKQLLAENLKLLLESDLDFSIEVCGFEMQEIDLYVEGLLSTEEMDESSGDSTFEAENGQAVTKPGDLWILGEHRLFCGNSLHESSFSTLMQARRAKTVFIDPPYNLAIDKVTGLGAIQHRNFAMAVGEMTEEQYFEFLLQNFSLLARNSEDGALHFICMDWRHIGEISRAGKKAYSELKNVCVWTKDNAGMGSFYRSQHELVFVFKHGNAAHCNNVQLGQFGRYRSNVWHYPGINSFSRTSEEGNLLRFHPTVKPIPLVADAILDSSRGGDLVLDSFLGSGTTLLAAERTGRICYGIELDPLYVDTAVRRWQALTGKSAREAKCGRNFSDLEQEAVNANPR
jgi:DNA modification methylase